MKAAVRRRYGPPEAVRIEEVPTPQPGDDEILVRVRAATVGVVDGLARRGSPARRYPLERIAEAHARVDAGHMKGDIVVTMP